MGAHGEGGDGDGHASHVLGGIAQDQALDQGSLGPLELALPVGGLAHVIEILPECGLGAGPLVHDGGSVPVLFHDSL